MNLQDVTLNEISQSQDLILHDSTYKNSSQTHKNRNGGCQGWREAKMGSCYLMGIKFQSGKMKKFWRTMVQYCAYS